jgi:hypothetical protein
MNIVQLLKRLRAIPDGLEAFHEELLNDKSNLQKMGTETMILCL